MLPGRITTPSALFAPREAATAVAGGASVILAWREVFKHALAADFPALFPHGDLPPDDSSRFALGEQLVDLRGLLCEEGFTIGTFREAYPMNPEEQRWLDLARLEERYLGVLRKWCLRDDCTAKLDAARAAVLPEGIGKITLLFCPDPPRLAVNMLEKLSETSDVTVCIHAPEYLQDSFDPWGRPLFEAWRDARLPIEDNQISLSNDRSGEIEAVSRHLSGLAAETRSRMALGVPDAKMLPHLRASLQREGVSGYDPAGEPMTTSALFGFLSALCGFIERHDFDSFAGLVRHPFTLEFLRRDDPAFDVFRFLHALDALWLEHLPPDYAAIRHFAARDEWFAERVERLAAWLAPLEQQLPQVVLLEQLAHFFAGMKLDRKKPEEAAFVETAKSLADVIDSLRSLSPADELDIPAAWLLLLHDLSGKRLSPDREEGAVDLLGWLELHWEDAPGMLVTGMTDDAVPEHIVGHLFLPDEARREMGLRDNATRFARDAYLLAAICASRDGQEVTFLFSARTSEGDPLKPSRLLFLCEDDALAQRANRLFGEQETSRPVFERRNDWLLSPPDPAALPSKGRVSVSDLNGYLACPFMYYLNSVLRMEPLETTRQELDALDFGSLAHEALRLFGESDLAECAEAEPIAAFLEQQVCALFSERFGESLSAPLLIQRQSLIERLRAAAGIQAGERRAGWSIVAVEQRFEMPLEDGITLKGTIDRIERRESGEIRILDYKTAEQPAQARDQHLRRTRHADPFFAAPDGSEWINLQLPLYVLLYTHAHPGTVRPACGYFNLPKAVSKTEVCGWDMESDELFSARELAGQLASRIRAGQFWPPRTKRYGDTFARLFHDTPEQGMDLCVFNAP